MREKLPAGMLELQTIPSVRPASIFKLHDLVGVNTIDELAAACRESRVARTKGSALERKILQGITIAR